MTKGVKYPKEFVDRLKAVTSKRPKTVIRHILKHGFITTEELEQQYGYKHAPRAARDVREQGIPLETFRVKSKDGRSIAGYRFADPTQIRSGKLTGRKIFSKAFKRKLLQANGSRCGVCLEEYEERYLQVDHRVPYEVAGDADSDERDIQDYMLLCGSCNRAKSWSCEHCMNWLEIKKRDLCLSCYWANPESYKHVALRDIRRLDIIWMEAEVEQHEKLRQRAEVMKEPMPDYVKAVLNKHLEENS